MFRGILSDLFPGVDIPEHDYGVFEKTIKDVMNRKHLKPVSVLVKKVCQKMFNVLKLVFVCLKQAQFEV